MHSEKFETPVALFAFNRPAPTRKVFDAIAQIRPARLLLIADGPRPEKQGEAEACRKVREIISSVDWPCEVSTNFAEQNLGCRDRVAGGLDWVFSLVEEAIILEDDCLPNPSFFRFCSELLLKYREDSRIGYISGASLVEKHINTDASYFFSRIGGIWGWATWRTRWQLYDRDLANWSRVRNERVLEEIFDDAKAVTYWTGIFDAMHQHRGPNTWDHQWTYTCFMNNWLTAVSSVNLIANIGFGADATHTTEEDSRFMLAASELKFPLRHPTTFNALRSVDRVRLRDMISTPLLQRLGRKLRRGKRRLLGGGS